MKYFYMAAVALCMLGAGIMSAEEGPKVDKVAEQGPEVVSQEKEIVTDLNDRGEDDEGRSIHWNNQDRRSKRPSGGLFGKGQEQRGKSKETRQGSGNQTFFRREGVTRHAVFV